ncbi:hypothetical protein PIB30_019404 [Stylosanthes scabra]|uniref:Uncharacterized protein n=1 Tax=Stylosanthes scabra TaxID=79078 RepID=A0ABU6Q8Q4_9FABA|nr:hypothetical protein [Stylosanthes scabra]
MGDNYKNAPLLQISSPGVFGLVGPDIRPTPSQPTPDISLPPDVPARRRRRGGRTGDTGCPVSSDADDSGGDIDLTGRAKGGLLKERGTWMSSRRRGSLTSSRSWVILQFDVRQPTHCPYRHLLTNIRVQTSPMSRPILYGSNLLPPGSMTSGMFRGQVSQFPMRSRKGSGSVHTIIRGLMEQVRLMPRQGSITCQLIRACSSARHRHTHSHIHSPLPALLAHYLRAGWSKLLVTASASASLPALFTPVAATPFSPPPQHLHYSPLPA